MNIKTERLSSIDRWNQIQADRAAIVRKINEAGKRLKEQESATRTLQLHLGELSSQIKEIDGYAELVHADIKVSDHAVLRYMERVLGMDIEAFRAAVLTESVRERIITADPLKRDGDYWCLNHDLGEYRVSLRDGVIVTVWAQGSGVSE